MGLFSDLGDLIFGTEGDAQKANMEQMERALGLLGGVPVNSLYGQGQAALDSAFKLLQDNYQSAINQTGAAGTGAMLGINRQAEQTVAEGRQNLANRGLYGSSMAQNMASGVRGQAGVARGQVASNVAGQQAGLLAGRGQALAGNRAQLAQLFGNQAGALLNQAGQQANVLTSYQHQGQPGIFGQLLGAGLGGIGGGLGLLGGNWASGGLLEKFNTPATQGGGG